MSSIIDPRSNRVIVCEGNENSPDKILYSRMFINPEPFTPKWHYGIRLIPAGGKQGIASYARGYARDGNYVVVRDRDLDAQPQQGGGLIQWNNGKLILTGRTCLESYFLSPELLWRYGQLRSLNLALEDCQPSLNDALHEVRDYQAMRWALQMLREMLKPINEESLGNRLTKADGDLPNLAEDFLKQQAQSKIETAQETSRKASVEALFEQYEAFKQRFDGDDFWNTEQPYDWFHGKDVLTAWLRRHANVNHADYTKWAAYHVAWENFADLKALQAYCLTPSEG